MAYEISEGATIGALYIKNKDLQAGINGGSKFWAVENNIIDAMTKIHNGIGKGIGTSDKAEYLKVFDPKTKGKVGKHDWKTRVTAVMHGYSAALAIQKWWNKSHKESLDLKNADKCYFTGGAWDPAINFLRVNHNGWADYNSSDLIVKKGSCFYGVSLKKKDTPTAANPPMINKSLIKLLETFESDTTVKKILTELKGAKAKYFGSIIHSAANNGPLKGSTGLGKEEDEFYTSIRHPKKSKGWISLIDMKGPAAFKFGNTNTSKTKDEDTGEVYDTFKYYITGVEKGKIICENTEPDAKTQEEILKNDLIQKAFGLGKYESTSHWKTRSYVNAALGNPNAFYKIVLKILDGTDISEKIGDLLLDSVLKVSLAGATAKASKKKCANCHFAFSLVTAVGKFNGASSKIGEADVKENPVIQSVISALLKENVNTKWVIKETMGPKKSQTLLEFKRTEAKDKGKEPPAKLFFTIGVEGKSKFHNILFLELRYKGTFSPWPQFLGGMSDEFMLLLKEEKKQKTFTNDCGKK